MNIYIDLLLLAAIVIYIVDVSGFTQGWRSLVAKWLGVAELKALPPWDCGQCMTWWTCAIYAVCAKYATLPVLAYCAALSLLSEPIGQFMHACRRLVGVIPHMIHALCRKMKS